jgi:hypothetical protein
LLKSFDIFEVIEYTTSFLHSILHLMKIKLALSFVFGLLIQLSFAQTPPSDASSAAKEFFTSLSESKTSTLQQLLGSDFLLLSFDGQTVDAATLLEGISGGYVVIDSGNTYGNQTRSYQDTGVVTGIWNVRGSVSGQSFNNRLAYTVVAVKQGGAWKIVSVQFTPS